MHGRLQSSTTGKLGDEVILSVAILLNFSTLWLQPFSKGYGTVAKGGNESTKRLSTNLRRKQVKFSPVLLAQPKCHINRYLRLDNGHPHWTR